MFDINKFYTLKDKKFVEDNKIQDTFTLNDIIGYIKPYTDNLFLSIKIDGTIINVYFLDIIDLLLNKTSYKQDYFYNKSIKHLINLLYKNDLFSINLNNDELFNIVNKNLLEIIPTSKMDFRFTLGKLDLNNKVNLKDGFDNLYKTNIFVTNLQKEKEDYSFTNVDDKKYFYTSMSNKSHLYIIDKIALPLNNLNNEVYYLNTMEFKKDRKNIFPLDILSFNNKEFEFYNINKLEILNGDLDNLLNNSITFKTSIIKEFIDVRDNKIKEKIINYNLNNNFYIISIGGILFFKGHEAITNDDNSFTLDINKLNFYNIILNCKDSLDYDFGTVNYDQDSSFITNEMIKYLILSNTSYIMVFDNELNYNEMFINDTYERFFALTLNLPIKSDLDSIVNVNNKIKEELTLQGYTVDIIINKVFKFKYAHQILEPQNKTKLFYLTE